MSEAATESEPVAFNPFEPGFFEDPYRQYAVLREHDPVHRSPLEVWVLFRYDDIVGVLRDPSLSVQVDNATPTARMQLFAEQAPAEAQERGAHSILNVDPPDHTRLRRLVSKAFTPKMVHELRPRIQELVDDALETMAARGEADVIGDLAFPLPFTVISEMLGMPDRNRDEVRGWSHTLTKTLDPILSPEEVQDALVAADNMQAHIQDVLAWKRDHPAGDLLTALLAAEDEGDRLSEVELLDQILLLYVAGHETTVNQIGNATLALLGHPDQLARLRSDPELDAGAVEELLRYDSPVQFSRRITTAALQVDGKTIPAGTFTLTCLGSANHDEARWGPTADELDVTRPDAGQHMSFGNGIHHCLGSSLARTEAQVAIGTLVRRFPDLALAGEPERNGRVVLRGLESLPVTVGS
ncbi:MAG TPA: cytochrome P450 [Acidimicrobiia bacterium]|nr:cytochrome P450 [Acidimicrobiia bacterium]